MVRGRAGYPSPRTRWPTISTTVPTSVRVNLNATVLAIGERAAALVRNEAN